jgi:hypothetical protein
VCVFNCLISEISLFFFFFFFFRSSRQSVPKTNRKHRKNFAMAQLHVKIFMGGDVRRRTLTAPFTFESLRAAVASVCAVPNAKIHFVDDDGDLVLIESDAEFAEARRCAVAPDTLHVGVGPDGAASLASASQLKKLGASVNTSSSTSNARPPREQSPKPRAVVSAPPTPAVAAPARAAQPTSAI